MKRKWDVSSKETRKKCVDEVLARLDEQEGSEFGMLAAEEIIDIVTENLAQDIYNKAVGDVKKLVQDRMTDMEAEIDLLENKG